MSSIKTIIYKIAKLFVLYLALSQLILFLRGVISINLENLQMKKNFFVVVTTWTAATVTTIPALADGNPAAGKAKSAVCAACHGANGNSSNPLWPTLAGQNAAYLLKQLADYKAGRRNDPNMNPIVQQLTAQDMKDLAAYYSSQTVMAGAGAQRNSNNMYRNANMGNTSGYNTGMYGNPNMGNMPAYNNGMYGNQNMGYNTGMYGNPNMGNMPAYNNGMYGNQNMGNMPAYNNGMYGNQNMGNMPAYNNGMYGNQNMGNMPGSNPNMYGNQNMGNMAGSNPNMYGNQNMGNIPGSNPNRYGNQNMGNMPGSNPNMYGNQNRGNMPYNSGVYGNPSTNSMPSDFMSNNNLVMRAGETFGVVMGDNPANQDSGMWALTAMPNCLMLVNRFSKPLASPNAGSGLPQLQVFVFKAQGSCRATIGFTRRSSQGVTAYKSYHVIVR